MADGSGGWSSALRSRLLETIGVEYALLLGSLCRTGTLNAVATLDNICLQAYRPRSAVEFEEQATGIAEHGANLVSSPEGSRRGSAVLARRR